MSVTAAIREMLAKGFTIDQALIAAEVFEGLPPVRSKAALRQERYRHNKTSQPSQTVTRDAGDAPSPDKEIPQTPLEINPNHPPYSPPATKRYADPAIILQSQLDVMTARRWVDHCAQKRKPVSAPQAESMAAALAEVKQLGGSAQDAVARSIKRGWTSIDLEWLRNDGMKLNGSGKSIDWDGWVQTYFADNQWHVPLGPKPGEAGCRAPPEVIAKYAPAAA
jgi:hypothetical protein